MKKRLAILVLAGAMAATSLTGCSSLNEKDVVATVDGDEITADVANFYARYTQAQYESYMGQYMGDDMWSSEAEEGKTYQDSVKDSIIESLENMYLLEDHMEEYGISLSDEEKQAIEDAAAEFDEANSKEDKKKVSGSQDTVERVLTLITVQNKVADAIMDTADTEVSDEEAAQKKMQYVAFSFTTTDEEGNSVDITDAEKEALKAEAEDFANAAKGADDFATYAAENGEEVVDATFDAESTSYDSALIAAADALEEGEFTDVVEGTDGYYVAKVISLFDEEATEEKKDEIISQRQNDKYTEIIDGWREEAEITVDEKVWAKIDFDELSVTIKQKAADVEETTEETPEDTTEDTTEDTADDAAAEEDTESTDDAAEE